MRESGIVASLSKLVAVEVILMPADSYAARNGLDLAAARQYWRQTEELLADSDASLRCLPASTIEQDPKYAPYLASTAYAFEHLLPVQQAKIMTAAAKYASKSDRTVYESAADYTMRRAAEAVYVENELGALWISLNYPERDIMAGDAPRMYAPEEMRTPWLKS